MQSSSANLRAEFCEMIDLIAEDYFERVFQILSKTDRHALLFDVYQILEPSGRDVRGLSDEALDSLQDLLISLFPNMTQKLASLI